MIFYMSLAEFAGAKAETKHLTINCVHDVFFCDAVNIERLQPSSIDLMITSPPYWCIKNYGNVNQIGFNDSLTEYIQRLDVIFSRCIDVLKIGRKMCINIGDQFIRASGKDSYQIVPLHAMIINSIIVNHAKDIVYLGSINWEKVSSSATSGGGQIMGSYPYPRSGYFFINREYIAIFKKIGKKLAIDKPSDDVKAASRMTLDQWRMFFKDTWKVRPEMQDSHVAMFPEELPARLMMMYSFVGDTVLDPFLGSGTTTLAAARHGRNSIGFEIGFETRDNSDWKGLIKRKVNIGNQESIIRCNENNFIQKCIKLSINNEYRFKNECTCKLA